MPLDTKSRKMLRHFQDEYGPEEGKRYFYGKLNKQISRGRPVKVGESRRLEAKRKRPHRTKRRSHTRRRKM